MAAPNTPSDLLTLSIIAIFSIVVLFVPAFLLVLANKKSSEKGGPKQSDLNKNTSYRGAKANAYNNQQPSSWQNQGGMNNNYGGQQNQMYPPNNNNSQFNGAYQRTGSGPSSQNIPDPDQIQRGGYRMDGSQLGGNAGGYNQGMNYNPNAGGPSGGYTQQNGPEQQQYIGL